MKRAAFVLVCSLLLLLVSVDLTLGQIPLRVLLQITKAEDERRWDSELRDLLNHDNAAIRKRAALAAGRIGNEDSVPVLTKLLQDADGGVRSMAAFALGEVESANAADALIEIVKNTKERGELRARALEALGKIAAALPQEQQTRQRELGAVIREALEVESTQPASQLTVLLGLTAALRSRPADAGPTIAKFLSSPDARVRSDAANALARLRLKNANDQLRKLLTDDPDPNVRANAARVLGATEDKTAFDALLTRTTSDPDSRVRVSSIRALAALKDPRAAEPLMKLSAVDTNELLEIATTLGRLLPQKRDQTAIAWLRKLNETLKHTAPEVELAFARIAPASYLSDLRRSMNVTDWRAAAAIANALGEIGAWPDSLKEQSDLWPSAETLTRKLLAQPNIDYAIPDVLRALAAFKPKDLQQILVAHLNKPDVIVRATAADLLGDLPPSTEITQTLIAAWPRVSDDSLNDASLSILDALGKQKTVTANETIKKALESEDYLLRRRAVALLKANGAGDFSSRIGTVKPKGTAQVYRRALSRIGRRVRAIVTTSKGSFTIELLPSEAPLTVDNFVQLAQRGYFRGITIHRVVPNFVIQDGDPRGDGNGGPGYQIRCEINQVLYDRATLGMALSGKDTGGSQWFVTHAPQPHLDGGYTVFGRVIAGMDVVDRTVRGDVVKSVVIR
ncbi:MAG TPA: HEAT repeat domain-containing protein [Pyrinomonadaceae bacterium]|nr:HEAT repeat domain-containing protein [Pyrinomonadaceae bacterium]